mgnify:CR=1 FL=1
MLRVISNELPRKYGVIPFHHWEYLGRHYNLYVTRPNVRLVELLNYYPSYHGHNLHTF